jgi:cyanate permease
MAAIDPIRQARTASGMNVVLGLWLIASAFIYGYADASVDSAWNSVIVGAVVVLFAALRSSKPARRPGLSGMNLVLGGWIAISPWVHGYATDETRLWNSLVVGVAIAVLALWSTTATASARRHAHS